MRDNNYNEMADKGWEHMLTLLDKELPVRKKKKRLGLIFLFFGMAFLTVGTGIYMSSFFNGDQTKGKQELNRQVDFFASDKSNWNVVKDAINTVESKVEEQRGKETASAKPSSFQKETVNARQAVSDKPSTARKQDLGFEVLPDSKLNVPLSQEIAITKVNIELDQDSELMPADSMKKGIAQENNAEEVLGGLRMKQSTAAITILPQLNLYIDNEISRTGIIPSTLTANKVKRPLWLYVDTKYHFPVQSAVLGFSGGLGISKAISRRLSLDVGLDLKLFVHNSNISMLDRTEFLDSGFGPDSGDPTYVPDVVSSSNELFVNNDVVKKEYFDFVANKIRSLRYIGIPMRLSYHLNSRHKIGLGVQYDYLIAAYNEKVYGISTNTLQERNEDLETDAFFSFNVISRHNFTSHLRYSYRLNRNFLIYSEFNYGLNPVIKTNHKAEMNIRRDIAIGLSYLLKM